MGHVCDGGGDRCEEAFGGEEFEEWRGLCVDQKAACEGDHDPDAVEEYGGLANCR
jgi:hypothetical protein